MYVVLVGVREDGWRLLRSAVWPFSHGVSSTGRLWYGQGRPWIAGIRTGVWVRGEFARATSVSSQICRPHSAIRGGLATPRMSRAKAQRLSRRKEEKRARQLRFGTWNVRTLVNDSGPVQTARRENSRPVAEDRKIDLAVRELRRFGVEVAGVQETHWFDSGTYRVEDSVVLSSGRPTPTDVFRRGEGVGIVLRNRAKLAFERGGCQWPALSSRVISCKLQFPDGNPDGYCWLHVLSCYAPTFRSSRAVKDTFFNQLQDAITKIPDAEQVIHLGDT